MLNVTNTSYSYTAESKVDDKVVLNFQANINVEDPKSTTISTWKNSEMDYKDNRIQARKDQAEFEDMIYDKIDTLLAEKTKENKV